MATSEYHNASKTATPRPRIWGAVSADSTNRLAILTDFRTAEMIARRIKSPGHDVFCIDFAGGLLDDEEFDCDLAETLAGYAAVLVVVRDSNLKWAICRCSTNRGLPLADLRKLEALPRGYLAGASFATICSLAIPWSVDFPGYELSQGGNRAA